MTLTLLVDMVLHSPEVWGASYDFLFLRGAAWWASMANAAANVALLLWWTERLARTEPPA